MTPEHHDIVLAITSHIPHLIAFNIVGTAADVEEVTNSEVIKFSAGGFRDFTRIAASDPVMWRDVFLNNKEAVLEMLGRFSEDLAALQRMIRWDDGTALLELFTRTRALRRGIIEAGQDTAVADFGRPHGHEGDGLRKVGKSFRHGGPGHPRKLLRKTKDVDARHETGRDENNG
jgi:cyclohexadieny/prephenate dehydrogenase